MHASRWMHQYASDDHLTKMRSVLLIRCVQKIASSSSTSSGSRIATLKRSLTWWTNIATWTVIFSQSTGRMFVWLPATPLRARFSTILSTPPLAIVWSNFQTIFTTSLKSISLKGDLSPKCWNWLFCSVQLCRYNDVINQSSLWLVSRLTAIKYR